MLDLTKCIIHSMSIKDLDEIKNNLETDFDDFWNYKIFKEELANTNSKYLVLRYDNKIVAFGGFKTIFHEADLMNIVTKKSERNKGFAGFLLYQLIDYAKDLQCKIITLEVNENNKPAICLYKKYDFKQAGLRKGYYRNGDNAILMTLKI